MLVEVRLAIMLTSLTSFIGTPRSTVGGGAKTRVVDAMTLS